MHNTGDMTLIANGYELLVNEDKTCIGIAWNIKDGYSQTLKRVIIPVDTESAADLGALLIAYSDWLAGRPIRDLANLAV